MRRWGAWCWIVGMYIEIEKGYGIGVVESRFKEWYVDGKRF